MADVIAYNGSDKWKQKVTELLNQGGGGGGLVDDVKVNGTSVVDENKVAQIDLSEYATQSYVINALDDYTTTAVLQANYYNKTEVNSRLANKADATSVYTKTEVNTALQGKADANTTYTKTEVDTALQSKANANSVYTKTEVDTALSSKANANSVYTKTEADNLLSAKANASDVYTKTETYSDDEVDALLSAKADTVDLATVATTGSYDDLTDKPTIPAAQVQSDWSEADNTKPDYIKNKPSNATQSTSGLMSSTDKTKLDGIASGAEVNVQSDWSQSDNTADDYIKNKPTIPTVNDGTLTLKNGDQTKGTFGANQSTAANVVILPFDITGNTTIGFTPVYPS